MRKTLLILLFIATVVPAMAQLITISGINQIPQIGDTLRYKDINTFGFELAGTGPITEKVWDLSTLTEGGSLEFFYIDPAETPEATSFPGTNLAEGSDQVAGYFYYVTGDYYMARKGVTGDMVMQYANDSATLYTFPFTAGHNYVCNYGGMLYASGLEMQITGAKVQMEADAQGTLMLPNGSVLQNVLRIHVIENFDGTYELVEGMPTVILSVKDDYYYWFHEDFKGAILTYGITTVESMGGSPSETKVLRYQPIETGTAVNSIVGKPCNIYPNPASDILHVDIQSENTNYSIYNASGCKVFSGNQLTIEIRNYEPGVYSVVFENSTCDTVKFIVTQ